MADCQDDLVARLAKSKMQADKYPLNLILSRDFQYTLAVYQNRLDEIENKLFHARKSMINVWDFPETNNNIEVQKHEIKYITKLQHVLERTPKDPHRRFIFLQSASSRDPLLCTRQQLACVFTHHQVMASFLDFVFTFIRREEPHSFASFRYENCISPSHPQTQVQDIGRSGVQTQHCFNILGIEPDKKNKGKWLQRQVASYHSFDLLERRSLSIIIKGDGAIQQRLGSIIELAKNNGFDHTNSVQSSFRQTLEDQLPLFQWGTENWEQYIESLEAEYAKFRDVAQHAPVEGMVKDIPVRLTADRMMSWSTETPSLQQTDSSQPPSPPQKMFKRFSSKVSTFSKTHEMVGIPRPPTPTQPHLRLEDLVSFDQLQSLSLLNNEIMKAISVIDQNKKLMADVKTYYERMVNSTDFAFHISDQVSLELCKTYTSDFIHQLTRLEGDLGKHQGNLRNILNNVEKMEVMLNSILQYRNMRTGEYFAKSSQSSADIMQMWTQDMHEKTASMHAITFFTLVFLPGTFVATIFSSGIITFGDDGTEGTGRNLGNWIVRQSALKLFFLVCMPLMFLTLCAWFISLFVARHRQSTYRDDRMQDRAAKMV